MMKFVFEKIERLWKVKFRNINLILIEEQVLRTYTNFSVFCFLGTVSVLAPNVWANVQS